MDHLILSKKDIEPLLTLEEAINAIENAFSDFAKGKAVLPPAIGFPVEEYNGEMHIKSGYMPGLDTVAIKIASSFPDNPKNDLPTVQSTILLHDSKTGSLLAIMDGMYITTVRTGAVGAVAAKYLAKENSKTVGVLGTGVQGKIQLEALSKVREFESVKAYSKDEKSKTKYAERMSKKLGVDVIAVNSIEELTKDVDILITATPSKEPIIMEEHVFEGMHINAIGSDNPKKQEIHENVFKKVDKIVADRLEQCKVAGEIHHALENSIIKESDVYAQLGEITSGMKKGREIEKEITLFDSTGVAVQDIATTALVYKLAKEKGIGNSINL